MSRFTLKLSIARTTVRMEAWAEPTPGSFGLIEGGDYVVSETAMGLTGRVGAGVWCWIVYSWLPARLDAFVRVCLLSLTCVFIDCMSLTQPLLYFHRPTVLFVSGFLRRLHRLLRDHLDWPQRMTRVSFARTNSPSPV